MIFKKRFSVAVVCMLAATTFAGLTQANAGERKFACYFKASGVGNGAYVSIWASSKGEAVNKTIAYLKRTKGSSVRIQSIDCRG